MSELDDVSAKKFKVVFTGTAAELRDALIFHFKQAEAEIHRNINGTDYAAGLEAGRYAGIGEVRAFLKKLVIADQ